METPIQYMWEGKYLQPYWKTGFIKADHRLKTFRTKVYTPDEFVQMSQGTYKNVHSNIFCKCKTLKQPNIHCRVGKKKKKIIQTQNPIDQWQWASCNSMDKYYKNDVGKKIPSLFHIHK